MRILIYGAGNIGCLYAALLKESGQEVSVLARGQRLADLRERGIRLEDAATGKRTEVRVDVVTRLDADDAYDVVLVVLPGNRISEVLPILRESRGTPSVVFFGNRAAGPAALTEALGEERVLLGFPGAAAIPHDQVLRYVILSPREQPTTIGELDGTRSSRIETLAGALRDAGFPVAISSDMDAWLKTHAAKIVPTANALYMAAGDTRRLARTRDALVLMMRAIRESFAVLTTLGIPLTPRSHAVLDWIPEPVLLFLSRKMLESPGMDIKVGHALRARSEIRALSSELDVLARESGLPTPSVDLLNRHLDPRAEPLPDGSSEIPVRWGAVWVLLGLAATLVALLLALA